MPDSRRLTVERKAFRWNVELSRQPHHVGHRKIRANLDEVQLAVAPHHLFVGKVVVDVGGVHLHDLVAQERQGLQRIQRIQHQEAAQVDVILHRGLRHVQRRQRIVAQQDPQLRIIVGSALLIQRLETW